MPTVDYVFFKRPSKFWENARQLRYEVFIKGQGIPEDLELDDRDQTACHLIALHNQSTCGVMRILQESDYAKFGRIAIHPSYRKQGIATAMVRQAIAFCHLAGINKISLNSQSYITHLYEKLGFKAKGEPFIEAGIHHLHMVLDFTEEEYCELPLQLKDSHGIQPSGN
ncbi:MAG: GNAT family N-acetyltransferase [Cyanobacteria bacterium P01_D01_bin.73]